jgi:crossover junction endodeoxyribonuclease RuvC
VRVLGIDPGLRVTGYGCVEGDAVRQSIVEAGVIRLVSGSGTPPIADRLVELERDAAEAIERLRPDLVAVESIFAHKDFPATAVAMGHARGVLLLCARRSGAEVVELQPRLIKHTLTGSGRASKEQMQRAIQRVLNLDEPPRPADVADALAIALAGLGRSRDILPS